VTIIIIIIITLQPVKCDKGW